MGSRDKGFSWPDEQPIDPPGGLIDGDAHVDLTPEGTALHRSLREYISGPSTDLLSQFELGDVETTVRTLQAITKRAAESPALAGA